jgi:hypothetical protein
MSRNVTVTFTDGSLVQYNNVPNSVTPDQIEQRAMSDEGKEVATIDGGGGGGQPEPMAPQVTGMPMGTVQTGDIESGFLMGLKDPINAGAQMLPRGLEFLSSAGGAYPNVVSQFFGDEAKRVDNLVQSEENIYRNARADAGDSGIDFSRIAGNVINPANLAVGYRAASMLPAASKTAQAVGTGVATSVMQPVVDTEDFAGTKEQQAAIGAIAGPAGAIATKVAGRVLSPLESAAEKTMRELGVVLTPGQMLGKQAKSLEEFAQNIPLIGQFISNARERQLFDFNRGVINKALSKVNEKLPEKVIGRDAISYVQQVINQKYDDVLKNVSMTYDQGVAGKLGNVISTSKVASAAKKQELNDLIDKLVYSQIPVKNLANKRGFVGTVDGDMFKNIEADINRTIARYGKSLDPNDQEIAESLKTMLKYWRSELSSQNPKQASQLRRINSAYGDVSVMETAAAQAQAQNGVFTPKAYQSAVRSQDKTRRKRSFAAGQARGQDVGDAAVDLLAPEAGAITEGRVALNVAGGYAALQNPILASVLTAASLGMYSKGGLKALEVLATKRPDLARKIGDELAKRATKEGSITGAMVAAEIQRENTEQPLPEAMINIFGTRDSQ